MDVFASETAPFAVALAVTLSIAVLELIGLLAGIQPSAAIDSALPDLDVDVDAPDLGGADAGFSPLSQVLSWLSFGRLPCPHRIAHRCGEFWAHRLCRTGVPAPDIRLRTRSLDR